MAGCPPATTTVAAVSHRQAGRCSTCGELTVPNMSSVRRCRTVVRRERSGHPVGPRRAPRGRPGGARPPRAEGQAVVGAVRARRSARARGCGVRQRPPGSDGATSTCATHGPVDRASTRPISSAGTDDTVTIAPGGRVVAPVAARARARTRARRGPRRRGRSGPARRAGTAPRRWRPPAGGPDDEDISARRPGRSVSRAVRAGGLDLLLEALGERRPGEAVEARRGRPHLARHEPPQRLRDAAGSSPGATIPASAWVTIRAASLPSPSTSTGRRAARYSNSLFVATLRIDAPPRRRAGCRRPAAARALRPVEHSDRARQAAQPLVGEQLPLLGGRRAGEHDLELLGGLGRAARSSARPRAARAGTPGHPARPVWTSEWRPGVSRPSTGTASRSASSGSKPLVIPDVATQALAEVVGDRGGDRDDAVRARQHRPLERAVGGVLQCGRPRGRGGSSVQPSRRSAIQGTPACAQRERRQVRRLRRRRRDHAVEALAASERQRARQREREPADEPEVGDDDRLERARARSRRPAAGPGSPRSGRGASSGDSRARRACGPAAPRPPSRRAGGERGEHGHRCPRRCRYLTRLAGRRAPESGLGGVSCATSRIDRPGDKGCQYRTRARRTAAGGHRFYFRPARAKPRATCGR